MPKLAAKLKSKGVEIKKHEPLWKGPSDDGPMGGITYSMLSRFLVCRERFRLYVIEGLKPQPRFSQRMEYGNLWHACEESFAAKEDWQVELRSYASDLCQTYKLEQEQVQHWYNVCKIQFPVYVKYWSKHKDVKLGTPLLQEYVFNVPYELPSGRMVRLRGKWDRVDVIGPKKSGRLWLQENKTKGEVDELKISTQLRFDLQSMLYYLALAHYVREYAKAGDTVIPHDYGMPAGVRYNVVRRPLAGGKHSIRKHQPTKKNPSGESDAEFYARLGDLIAEEPDWYFHRWNVDIAPSDLAHFEQRFFIPVMEQLCDWYDYLQSVDFDPWSKVAAEESKVGYAGAIHWQHPHGTYNVLNEGGTSELDEYIATGSMLGLTTVDKLFTELE